VSHEVDFPDRKGSGHLFAHRPRRSSDMGDGRRVDQPEENRGSACKSRGQSHAGTGVSCRVARSSHEPIVFAEALP
jgi:hypothetical protein